MLCTGSVYRNCNKCIFGGLHRSNFVAGCIIKKQQPSGDDRGTVYNNGGIVFTAERSPEHHTAFPWCFLVSNMHPASQAVWKKMLFMCPVMLTCPVLVLLAADINSFGSRVQVPQTELDHRGQTSLAMCIKKPWLPITLSLVHHPSFFGPLLIVRILVLAQ